MGVDVDDGVQKLGYGEVLDVSTCYAVPLKGAEGGICTCQRSLLHSCLNLSAESDPASPLSLVGEIYSVAFH